MTFTTCRGIRNSVSTDFNNNYASVAMESVQSLITSNELTSNGWILRSCAKAIIYFYPFIRSFISIS